MRLPVAAITAAAILSISASPSLAAQQTVDDDWGQCPAAEHTSIQAAVTAASPGDTIRVCAGVYQEQVQIPAGKDGLKLFSTPKRAAVIKAPPVMAGGNLVHVNGARDVNIDRFVISGPLPDATACGAVVATGVRVGGGGSAGLADNHITEIRATNPALRGCQNGIGVLVGRRANADVGQAQLRANLIDRYQKGGVVVDNAGSYGEIDQNRIEGDGPNPLNAQNGVQVGREADADVFKNVVVDNMFTGSTPFSASGILLFEATGLNIKDNYVGRNDVNVSGSGNLGALTDSVIEKNETIAGVYDGIYMDEGTAGNLLRLNFARSNGVDCEDYSIGPGTAGTANFWEKNDGRTDNRGGQICSPRGGDKPGKQKEPRRRNFSAAP